MDLILRNATLQDGSTVDIGINQGVITSLQRTLTSVATQELDLSGALVLPAFVNAQLHACKSFWRRLLPHLPPEQQALPRFQAAHFLKEQYTVADVVARVDETIRLAIQHGTCAIRLFADVDDASGLTAVEALLQIREQYRPWLKIQVVAFPQDGVTSERTAQLMREALVMGADVVGGIPWIEASTAAQQGHTAMCFALAHEFDRDLHFVCDDVMDPASRTLEMVARQALASGWQGRVAATQCAALAAYPDNYAQEVIQLIKAAAMTICVNSHVALIATEFPDRQPWPRGITRVRELLAAGVPVACGQDDIDNWFYPFGRNDLLEVAHFMAHTGQFAWRGEVDRVLPMVTTAPAQLLAVEKYGVAVGCAANLVVLDAADWHETLQFQASKRYILLNGKIVCENIQKTLFAF
ncbi:MAG TPA: amidohydrolase family protein [Caldilineaceae bacterium]|nr:amidohydrolase family protein [Caldilineaceae bacterium]